MIVSILTIHIYDEFSILNEEDEHNGIGEWLEELDFTFGKLKVFLMQVWQSFCVQFCGHFYS